MRAVQRVNDQTYETNCQIEGLINSASDSSSRRRVSNERLEVALNHSRNRCILCGGRLGSGGTHVAQDSRVASVGEGSACSNVRSGTDPCEAA